MKTIALIAHDEKKKELIAFAKKYTNELKKFNIVATGTTGKLIEKETGLKIKKFKSGPLGGDAQIASKVACDKVHAVFFIIDPLTAHPHEPDINTLMRVCNVYNVPLALNISTAILLLSSHKI